MGDDASRMKGFSGDSARRMILQALGKDPDKKSSYKPSSGPAPEATPSSRRDSAAAKKKPRIQAAPVVPEEPSDEVEEEEIEEEAEYEVPQWGDDADVPVVDEDESEFQDTTQDFQVSRSSVPPAGTKVIRLGRKRKA